MAATGLYTHRLKPWGGEKIKIMEKGIKKLRGGYQNINDLEG